MVTEIRSKAFEAVLTALFHTVGQPTLKFAADHNAARFIEELEKLGFEVIYTGNKT